MLRLQSPGLLNRFCIIALCFGCGCGPVEQPVFSNDIAEHCDTSNPRVESTMEPDVARQFSERDQGPSVSHIDVPVRLLGLDNEDVLDLRLYRGTEVVAEVGRTGNRLVSARDRDPDCDRRLTLVIGGGIASVSDGSYELEVVVTRQDSQVAQLRLPICIYTEGDAGTREDCDDV